MQRYYYYCFSTWDRRCCRCWSECFVKPSNNYRKSINFCSNTNWLSVVSTSWCLTFFRLHSHSLWFSGFTLLSFSHQNEYATHSRISPVVHSIPELHLSFVWLPFIDIMSNNMFSFGKHQIRFCCCLDYCCCMLLLLAYTQYVTCLPRIQPTQLRIPETHSFVCQR